MQISRRLIAVTAACGLLLLGACGGNDTASSTASPSAPESAASPSASGSPSPSATPKPVKASTNLDAITVTGKYGTKPTVKFKAPWAIDKTRTKVLSEGKGATVQKGGTVEVNYEGVDARTGETFDESFSRKQSVAFPLDQVIPGFQKGLEGQKVGSRVLIAMPGKDGYDASGGNQQAGIQVGDTLLFVVDVVATTLTGPEGKTVAPKAGMPTVKDSGGKPDITIPKGNPPSKLEVAPLIQGDGRAVAETDTITVHYRSVSWKTGKIVEDNFGKAPESGPLAQLIPGWQQGLKGQKVGSRVLLVVPPDLAYPEGNATPKIDKGDTLVYVVDILFATQGQ